ncbi:hypothetical protein FB107DRAFT_280542 [Schizophyllum commune]
MDPRPASGLPLSSRYDSRLPDAATYVEHCLVSSLFPYALHSTTTLAFNIVRASTSAHATPSLCTPLYETAMHSTTPLCTPLCKMSRLSTSPNSRKASSTFTLEALSTRIPAIVVDSRAEATYLRPPSGVLHSQMTLPSAFAFAIDLGLSLSTYAFCGRAMLRTRVALELSSFNAPSSVWRKIISASKVTSSSASKDLRGKHNARRRFLGSFLLEDDDHRIVRGKYKRREGKATQVYRKKWVISRWLASITAARLIASITAARLLVPRPLQNPVVIPQSSHTIIPPPNRVAQ